MREEPVGAGELAQLWVPAQVWAVGAQVVAEPVRAVVQEPALVEVVGQGPESAGQRLPGQPAAVFVAALPPVVAVEVLTGAVEPVPASVAAAFEQQVVVAAAAAVATAAAAEEVLAEAVEPVPPALVPAWDCFAVVQQRELPPEVEPNRHRGGLRPSNREPAFWHWASVNWVFRRNNSWQVRLKGDLTGR